MRGLADINTTGGFDRQMVVEPDPDKLAENGLDLGDVCDALARNTAPGGGGLIDLGPRLRIVHSDARAQTPEDIAGLTVKTGLGARPVLARELAVVTRGTKIRVGAATLNGEEAVLGTALMLAGENGRAVARRFADTVAALRPRLPGGVEIVDLSDRSLLVDGVLATVRRNLGEGALLVVALLLLFLGNWRAALIVAVVIPLAFVLGLAGLTAFHLSGNLMSLGAIDFGLLVDGAVVLVENAVRRLDARRNELGRALEPRERAGVVLDAAREVAAPTVFGVVVIALVYVPIFGLGGVGGKMFAPMAGAAVLCLLAALGITLTFVPALCVWCLRGRAGAGDNTLVAALKRGYAPLLALACQRRGWLLAGVLALAGVAAVVFLRLGEEFLPRLDEGSLVVEVRRPAGGGLEAAVATEIRNERAILDAVPEVTRVFSRVGQSDIATDPQSPDENDIYVSYKPRARWREKNGHRLTKAELTAEIVAAINARVPGQELATNQPIELRFDELLEGVRADVAIKIFGRDYDQLDALAGRVRDAVARVPGAGEVVLEEVGRVDTTEIVVNRQAMRTYQVTADEIDNTVSTALTGRVAGRIDDGERFYPLVVRLSEAERARPDLLRRLPFRSAERSLMLVVGQVASARVTPKLGTIYREGAERRRAVLVNVRGRDLGGFVAAARTAVDATVPMPPGFRVEFGGAFRNLEHARARLRWLIPATLAGMYLLVALALGSWRRAAIVYAVVPLAVMGGVFALAMRGMPFTMSAAVGFHALAGLATLNGLVLATAFEQRLRAGRSTLEAALESALMRLRPVLMTAAVASLGLLPMAVSTAPGAEVQRPLATVVIGGIISATALTLLLIPALLGWLGAGPKPTTHHQTAL